VNTTIGWASRRHLSFVGRYGLGGSDWHQPNGHSHYLGLAPGLRYRGSSAPEVLLSPARSLGIP